MNTGMKICFMGGQNTGLLATLTLLARGHHILAAVSQNKELVELLTEFKVPVMDSVKNPEFVEQLSQADLLLSVHGQEIVPMDLLSLPKRGGINLHPYLYKYKGAHPIERALADKEFRASVGAHVMDRRVDEGKILLEEFVDVSGSKSVEEVYNKLYPYYVRVLNIILKDLEDGKI